MLEDLKDLLTISHISKGLGPTKKIHDDENKVYIRKLKNEKERA